MTTSAIPPSRFRCALPFALGLAVGGGLTLEYWASTCQNLPAAAAGATLCLVGVTIWGVRSGP